MDACIGSKKLNCGEKVLMKLAIQRLIAAKAGAHGRMPHIGYFLPCAGSGCVQCGKEGGKKCCNALQIEITPTGGGCPVGVIFRGWQPGRRIGFANHIEEAPGGGVRGPETL